MKIDSLNMLSNVGQNIFCSFDYLNFCCLLTFFRFGLDSYETTMGNLIARANVTEIPYVQSGTYTCKADSNGLSDMMSIIITVQCRKLIQNNNKH